jgi:hypothetical protein
LFIKKFSALEEKEIRPRVNIKYGFNPDGIKRKINSIGQAGPSKRPFMDRQ